MRKQSNNRTYNINDVVNEIGLKNQISYDQIEIFIDITNYNNIWARVTLTDCSKNKPVERTEIKRFRSNMEMLEYVKSHFGSYELEHPVDFSKRHIFFHNVDYIGINYYQHNRSSRDYLELNYREFVNNQYIVKKESFKKEDEELVYNIFRTSKRLSLNMPIDSSYINYLQAENIRVKRTMPEELEKTVQDEKQKQAMTRKEKRIKIIKIVMATAALTALLHGGFRIIKNTIETEDILTQDKPRITSGTDMHILSNKKKAGTIIDKLMDEDYEDLTIDDIDYIKDYINSVELSNYDFNDSTSMFNLSTYFSDKIFFNQVENRDELMDLVKKIDEYYRACFKRIGDRVVLMPGNTNKYISYVLSLVFMYDTTVDLRGSGLVDMNTQSIFSEYATKEDISNYESLPPILKYIITNQLSAMLLHTDYKVTKAPSNYYNGLDKYDLINRLRTEKKLLIKHIGDLTNGIGKTI